MGYLSSAIGKPLKWLGGAAALYGGYKLATSNSRDISESITGGLENLDEESSGMEAIYSFLDSTGEQVRTSPDYGANLGTAGKGLAIAAIGAYLDGSFSSQDLPDDYVDEELQFE